MTDCENDYINIHHSFNFFTFRLYHSTIIAIGPMSNSLDSSPLTVRVDAEDRTRLLPAINDDHGGVIVDMEEPMDSKVFLGVLRASMSQWKREVSFVNFIY